ncbi:hypothetical protein DFO70_11065 [Cytobacillus firmus]|uniref:Uncharacterized protein n=2 Tax=Cytobacillus TaxID=2675230 RepID=A0A366JPE1_CYTFI|nr:hypothetical protein DFO70_11065 [Cytobacillus firmus]TDX40408.1 hypothetical protein DFO72_10976 [Cytobacillus oceanisediminis]
MIYFRFCFYQFFLFSIFFFININLDKYISKPFTRVDLIAICISVPILIILFIAVSKIYRRFEVIRLQNKIFISIPIFIISVLCVGFLEQLFF